MLYKTLRNDWIDCEKIVNYVKKIFITLLL